MLGVPIYAVASWLIGEPPSRQTAVRVLRIFAVTLPCLVFLLFFRRFLDDLEASPWLRDATLVGYALGSMAFAYGLMFVGHQLAAVCLASAMIAFYSAGKRLSEDRRGGSALAAWQELVARRAPRADP